jgi:hypothetical protein
MSLYLLDLSDRMSVSSQTKMAASTHPHELPRLSKILAPSLCTQELRMTLLQEQ